MSFYQKQFELLRKVLLLANQLQTGGDTLYEEVSAKQWYLLCYIDGFEEQPPTLKELASVMGTSHQNVKQMASKLEKKGYIRFFTDPDDRRKTRVRLTEKCEPLWEKYLNRQERYIQQIFQPVTEEQVDITLETLGKLTESVRL